jgi:cyclophilin family peptidyl-prolyl cis-trans isomerase
MTWMVCLAAALMQTAPAVQSASPQPAADNPVLVTETSARSITIEPLTGYSPDGFRYPVFGRVIDGKDGLDRIAATAAAERGGMANLSVTAVMINGVTVKQ